MKTKCMWLVFFLSVLVSLLCVDRYFEIIQGQGLRKKIVIGFILLSLIITFSVSFIKLVILIVVEVINNYFNRAFVFMSVVTVILTFSAVAISLGSGNIELTECFFLMCGTVVYISDNQAIILQKDAILFYNGGFHIKKVVDVVIRNKILCLKFEDGKEAAVSIKICSAEQMKYLENMDESVSQAKTENT